MSISTLQKTIRGATTRKLLPEQYVEMHLRDAKNYGIRDGDWVRVVTRRAQKFNKNGSIRSREAVAKSTAANGSETTQSPTLKVQTEPRTD